MTQLTKNMYRRGSTLFGLRDAQMRRGSSKITHNSGWYNKAGEALGWGGDLAVRDLKRIRDEIALGELFILLSDQDARYYSLIADLDAPGVMYVAQHCYYIIELGSVFIVSTDQGSAWSMDGLTPIVITPEAAKKHIVNASSLP